MSRQERAETGVYLKEVLEGADSGKFFKARSALDRAGLDERRREDTWWLLVGGGHVGGAILFADVFGPVASEKH